MKTKKKLILIISLCIALVAVFSGYSLWKTFRPSRGLPYEQLTAEKALDYMEFEVDYQLVDVRSSEAYDEEHLSGAVSLPLKEIAACAAIVLPDLMQMIYVYGADGKDSAKAAQILSDLGYRNISEIGSIDKIQKAILARETADET